MESTVSLLIKASYQGDGDMLYRQVHHIVTMLEKKSFCEVILVFDSNEGDFIRQYAAPHKQENIDTANLLTNEGYLDRWVVSPSDEKTVRELYQRWYGSETTETHTAKNAPMSQPIFAFEITKGEYTLQADADVLICRRDWNHNYLQDMIDALNSAENVVSVGFNIAHKSNDFKPYSSPCLGEFVPEVRICLFNKERLLALRPFPNEIINGKYALTWYRSLQKLQHDKGMVSLRGGDGRTFYIHPQNDVKKDKSFLYGAMREIEHNHIPDIQFGKVDLIGTPQDWNYRKETDSGFHKLSHLIRASKLAYCLNGPEFPTNLNRIEIDITYDCHLRCRNCARSCSQAPDKDSLMSIQQIKRFVEESIANNVYWENIGLLGGEPFLHPQLKEICSILLEYKSVYSPETPIQITTSGNGKDITSQFSEIPAGVSIINTHKQTPHQSYFEPFNLAPIDQKAFLFSDYRNGCSTTSDCGLGLNKYGYYVCGVGGGIDRVMGFDIGLKHLPFSQEELMMQRSMLCRYCGHFCSRHYIHPENRKILTGEPRSKSWVEAYRKFEQNRPNLTLY